MKITIVGGGTAGWISAYILQKSFPEHDITIIESSKIGIIGVGEGSTHILGSLVKNSSIQEDFDIRDFIVATDAAPKHGFKHVAWTNEKNHFYIPLDLNLSSDPIVDDFLAMKIAQEQPIHAISDTGVLIEQEKTIFHKDNINIEHLDGLSYHFDGKLVGEFFKKHVVSKGASLIDDVILDIKLDQTGSIESLALDNGANVVSDLFVDCTGMAKLLMNKLGGKWLSYKDTLLVNSALPYPIPYNPPVSLEPVSISTALSAGWTWRLPLAGRFGCGYVFCDNFITFDQAHLELQDHLGIEIKPFREIKFNSGRFENVWIKNCVSLGLAAAFVEPLEATSIHASTLQVQKLVTTIKNGITEQSVKEYNDQVSTLYDEIKEFIALHYTGGRNDTEFWIEANKAARTDFVNHVLEIAKTRFLRPEDIPNKESNISYQAWNQLLAGLGHINKDVALKQLANKDMSEHYAKFRSQILTRLENCKTVEDTLVNGRFNVTG